MRARPSRAGAIAALGLAGLVASCGARTEVLDAPFGEADAASPEEPRAAGDPCFELDELECKLELDCDPIYEGDCHGYAYFGCFGKDGHCHDDPSACPAAHTCTPVHVQDCNAEFCDSCGGFTELCLPDDP